MKDKPPSVTNGSSSTDALTAASVPTRMLDGASSDNARSTSTPNDGTALATTEDGVVGTQGSTALQADQLRSTFGVDGTGVKVGVLSDSFNVLGGAAADEADGDLPASGVTVLADGQPGDTDEGRAMLELVHQIAPGAQLFFATVGSSDAAMAANIQALRNAGCNIIIDDTTFFDEPFFQPDAISQAIDNVVANGAMYFTAAGNDASNAYQSVWRGTNGDTQFNFNSGAGAAITSQSVNVTIFPGASVIFDLQWDQPFHSPSSEFELLVTDQSGGSFTATGGANTPGDVAEADFALQNNTASPISTTLNVAIDRLSGPDPSLIKYIASGDGQPVSIDGANTGTVFGHHEDPNAITVGAANSAMPTMPESFTSSGAGSDLLFDANGNPINQPVSKVDLTGVDGINTSLPGGLSDFFGTSASVATAAAVAALIEQAAPGHSNTQIEQALENTAENIGAHAITGFGLVQALQAAASLVNPPPPVATTADMILRRSDGSYEIYDIGNNSILAAYSLGQVGSDYKVAGLGDFDGRDTTDMLLRSSTTGAFEVYDISNNNIISAASFGQVGNEWQVAGFGNFNASDATGMMMRDNGTGGFELYDISDNSISSASAIGQVGLEWQVAGFGKFNGDGTTDMLLRDSLTGTFEVYDIEHGEVTSASSLGQVGSEWQVAGFGDFNGSGATDMMMRDTLTGAFELYDISNNKITSARSIGDVGLEWQVAGFGSAAGVGTSDMILRDTLTGAFEVYDISNSQLTAAASLGQVGLDWQVGGIAVDPPIRSSMSSSQLAIERSHALLVQAISGFSSGGAVTSTLASAPAQEFTAALIASNPLHHAG